MPSLGQTLVDILKQIPQARPFTPREGNYSDKEGDRAHFEQGLQRAFESGELEGYTLRGVKAPSKPKPARESEVNKGSYRSPHVNSYFGPIINGVLTAEQRASIEGAEQMGGDGDLLGVINRIKQEQEALRNNPYRSKPSSKYISNYYSGYQGV